MRTLLLSIIALGLIAFKVNAQPQASYFVIWVDTTALSGGDGSQATPFQTLNDALKAANDYLYDDPPFGAFGKVRIKVRAPEGNPIAPAGFGGLETAGWTSDAEEAAGCLRKPFPIRMIPFVDVFGVYTDQKKPVITLIETIPVTYVDAQWTTNCGPEVRSVVRAASNCELRSVVIDGSGLIDSSAPQSWPGVDIPSVTNFTIRKCDVKSWQDQLCILPGSGGFAGVLIDDCVLDDAWPPNPVMDMQGHAGLWVVGPGDAVVDMIDTTIQGCHDAVELDGDSNTVVFTATGCTFRGNENGFEMVEGGSPGTSIATVVVDGGKFEDNVPRPLSMGFPLPSLVGSIVARGDPIVNCTVRNVVFLNNSSVAVWGLGPISSPISRLDLGTDTSINELPPSHGENQFCLEMDPVAHFPNPALIPYKSCLIHSSDPGNAIYAAGNYWLSDNQGSASTDLRVLANVSPETGVINWPPPGPGVACYSSFPAQFDRNYSIANSANAIRFGTTEPDFVPAPIPCKPCGTP